jgi:segregation and condensation protein A
MLDTSIQVKLDHFDGPLGLLLMLIEKEEMDIKKLELTDITAQYLAYLSRMEELNFDIAGDYLYMAAALLLIKSKACLSEDDVKSLQDELNSNLDITSETQLIRRLEEYKKFQLLGQKLWEIPKLGHEIFIKPKVDRKTIINSILTPVELSKLTVAMMDIIKREKRKYTVIKRDRLSIKEKLQFLKNYLKKGERTDFENLLDKDGERAVDNILITFISLLELARLRKVSIFQNEHTGNIYLDVLESFEDFDVDLADGFEEDEEEEIEIPIESLAKIDDSSIEVMQ